MNAKQREKGIWDEFNDYEGFDENTFSLLKHCGKLKCIVEVGCGSGAWTTSLCEVAEEVIGIDFSSSLIKETHRKLHNSNCKVILADAEFLPLREESVDQCIFTFSLHHVSNIKQCLKGMSRCLKKSGLAILIEPNGSNFARVLAYRIGRLPGITGSGTSKPVESPVNINAVIQILTKLGFKCLSWPCSPTITISEKSSSSTNNPLNRMYIKYLKIAKLVFPDTYGSSDFFLIGKKEY